jgi:hypothetical protein
MIQEKFLEHYSQLKPRHQRDIGRVINLTKAVALLNLWHREHDGSDIVASEEDFQIAWDLWMEISKSQSLNLPPYVLNIYEEIIVPACVRKGSGISSQEILSYYSEIGGQDLSDSYLRKQVLKTLYASGLIYYERDPDDYRRQLICVPDDRRDTVHETEETCEIHPEKVDFGMHWPMTIGERKIVSEVYVPDQDDTIPF